MRIDELRETIQQVSTDLTRHFAENRDRINYTVGRLASMGLEGKKVCEVGFGEVGLACQAVLGAEVHAYDASEWFRPVCDHFQIPWERIDLHQTAVLPHGPYDLILLCEVVEHLSRWPVQVFRELHGSLKPGGTLLVTTPNLHRLSNRLRMLMGKPLFANFLPEELLMAHLREYTPEELALLLRKAEFADVRTERVTLPGKDYGPWTRRMYLGLCRLLPGLSNFIFCWARRAS